jgi:hypothetical protein
MARARYPALFQSNTRVRSSPLGATVSRQGVNFKTPTGISQLLGLLADFVWSWSGNADRPLLRQAAPNLPQQKVTR